MRFLQSTSLAGIGFSLFVAALAAFNLALDFDFIENGSKAGLPKHMEWFAALGLLAGVMRARESGIGHENSLVAMEHYTQLKTVYVEMGEVACGYR